ncbi:lymphocyte cytosolic protein 2a isoform X2 [Poecilia latipinna]|uniref:lymphocyte cytosolic protein 2a isoform X2 n=1 Tax=Poecilia latipinna TaxID=48699 RepID=UPI00072DEAF3|nr:PREDICTED: lymphocyte cytosolic protein 2 isoform X2 [Poecilia latipinna]
MSSVPQRSVVMGWSPQQLADYLKRMNLPGCDKVVLKNSISGSRFVNLTDNDLQKFPKLHAPMISKISNEIYKNEKKGLFSKKSTPKYQEPEMNVDGGWGEDEFDDEEFDDDYESPYSDEDDRDYESPNDDLDAGNDYEPPPSEPAEDHKLCPSQPIGDGDYIDRRDNNVAARGPPPALCPRPPTSLSAPPARMPVESRRDPSPHGRPPGNLPAGPPKVCRDIKPGRESRNTQSPIRGHQFNSADRPGAQSWRTPADASEPPRSKPPVLPPPSSSVSRSNSSARVAPPSRFDGHRETQDIPKHNTFPLHKNLPPRPGIPGPLPQHAASFSSSASLPHKLQSAMAEHRGSIAAPSRPPPPTTAASEALDPNWYVGKVSRGQAEGCLKKVQRDGAYLVRDSTRQQPNQPFTLMVFYQDKVYNIQIRQHSQQFQLGTGLKAQEFFPSVSDIINHYSQSPLVLIDAKNRSSSHQNQCLLSDPAGYYLEQSWS